MATLKVKFKAIGLRGEPIRFTQKIECPDFQEIETETNKYIDQRFIDEGIINSKITVEEQQEEWLSDFDKWSIIVEKDIDSIVDWAIIRKKKKVNYEEIKFEALKTKLLEIWSNQPDRVADFLSIYQEMFPKIKRFSLIKRFEIVLQSYIVATKATAVFADRMVAILRGENLTKDQQQGQAALPQWKR